MKGKKSALLLAILFCTVFCAAQQHTVGLLSSDPARAFDGYTLLYPHNQGNVYLVNNCGQVVHCWPDTEYLPGNAAKLMPDGSIYITKGKGDRTNRWITGSGGAIRLEHRDWDNHLLWEFTYSDSLRCMHHDFTVLPNGNIVLIAWQYKSFSQALEAGRDSLLMNDCRLWVDQLVEIKPEGKSGGDIVWNWNAWDHLIQDRYPGKKNYGVVKDHPERIDLNCYHVSGYSDWLHLNSVDYNPQLDLLLVSTPALSEVWMIDHSTTSQEASGHSGGRYGKGGDLVFRWGNPKNYRNGTAIDQQLDYQHDAHWIGEEAAPDDPRRGAIIIFNNHSAPGESSVVIIRPQYDVQRHSFRMEKGVYLPAQPELNLTIREPVQLSSESSSSVQVLSNGNLFICSGRSGYCFERDSSGRIVWEYVIPLNHGESVPQGYKVPVSGNIIFRARKYPAGWPTFSGRDLSPKGYWENHADTSFCNMQAPELLGPFAHLKLSYELGGRNLRISGFMPHLSYRVSVYDAGGRTFYDQYFSGPLCIPELPPGENSFFFLIIQAENGEQYKLRIIRV